jgi:DNA polymerase-3 subunit delta'
VSIWDRLVGQPEAEAQFRAAAASAHGHGSTFGMTQAWLVTGPPGSGRSIAAICLAAALVCPHEGCGVCEVCRTVLAGSNPDVTVVRSTTLSHGKEQTKALVVQAAGTPIVAPWRVLVVEDADRMTEAAANTLLKAIEEPLARTVWILCAPSPEDVIATIRSRTRHVGLRVPSPRAVTDLLVGEGVDPALASFAATASQGHIGRARALATDEAARSRRAMILKVPRLMATITDAYTMAAELRQVAEEDAKLRSKHLDEQENATMLAAYGQGAEGVSAGRVRTLASRSLSELSKTQSQRASRSVRDELDRYFVDFLGYYRDVLMLQLGLDVGLVNVDLRPAIEQAARTDDETATMRRIDAITAARAQLEGNVPPALVCESLLVQLLHPVL